MTHDQYVEMLKDFLMKRAVASATKYLVSKFTFLAWGPFGPLLEFVLKKVMKIFLEHTELAIFMKFTDFRVSRQGRAFSEAVERNYEAQKNGTPEEKEKAEQNLKDRFREFVKLTN